MIGQIPRLPQLERKGGQAKFPARVSQRADAILRISRFLDSAYGAGFQEAEPTEPSESGTGKEKT